MANPVKRKKVGKGKGGKYARTADDLEEEDDDDIVEGEDLEVEAARIRKELSARPMLDDAPVAAEDDKPVPLAIRAPVVRLVSEFMSKTALVLNVISPGHLRSTQHRLQPPSPQTCCSAFRIAHRARVLALH